jgi:drug/metabolite transporter (DMT)-like permease
MGNWLFFALLSPATYAIINFIDKYLIESRVKDYRGMPLYSAIAGFIFGTGAWLLFGLPTLNWFEGSLVLLTGIISIFALTMYFRALSQEETSIIIILFQLGPLFSLSLSYLVLGESITFNQLSGFLLILIAAIGASLKISKNKFAISQAFWLILICNFFWALANVLFKFVSESNSFVTLLVYEGWGFGVGGIILSIIYPASKNAFIENFKTVGGSVMSFIFLNESVFVLARLVTYFALTLAPVAIVVVVGSTQVFFGVVYGILLTLFLPKIFKEDISKPLLIRKLLWAVLAVCGVFLTTQ